MQMNEKEKRFEVLSVGEMREKYYLSDEKPPTLRIDPQNVPIPLRSLIPYAEKWGISDDILRGDFVAKACSEELGELRKIVASHDDLLDGWLAGPEGQKPPFSPEYLAFTHMRMAADGC